jgi:hypothetical protein
VLCDFYRESAAMSMIVAFNAFDLPSSFRSPAPPPQHINIALRRLRLMLARDEQTRRPPPITLPRLAGHGEREREPVPIPEPAAPRPAIPIAAIVRAVAAHFGLPPDRVVRNGPSTQPRPLPMNVALYFVRTLSGATYEHAARELGIRSSEVVSAGHRKVAHQRHLDPDLARQLAAIEAVLNAT